MYDSKCYELAQHFLEELRGVTERDIHALAQAIQNACEDACDEVEQREQAVEQTIRGDDV